MRETIETIAEKAKVSKSTVDRALKNQPGVSPETRERILRVAEACGYKRNTVGSALRRQNSPMIIAVVFQQQLFEEQIREGMLAAEREHYDLGIRLRFFESKAEDVEEQYRLLQWLKTEKIRGVIMNPIVHPKIVEAVDELEERKIPVITLSSDLPSSRRFQLIGQDYFRAGRVAGELMATALHGEGHVGIFQESVVYQAYSARTAGFQTYLRENAEKIRADEIIRPIAGDSDYYRLTLRYLRENEDVNGILCTGPSYMEAAWAILDSGREVVLIGYDIFRDTQELFRKGAIKYLITQNPYREGFESVRTLFRYFTEDEKEQVFSPFTMLNIVSGESIEGIDRRQLIKF